MGRRVRCGRAVYLGMPLPDRWFIKIEGAQFRAAHGVHAYERAFEPRFLVHLELEVPPPGAAQTDDLSGDVDYNRAYNIVARVMQGEPVQTLEHLIHKMAYALEREFKDIRSLKLEITKKTVQLGGPVGGVSVRMERKI